MQQQRLARLRGKGNTAAGGENLAPRGVVGFGHVDLRPVGGGMRGEDGAQGAGGRSDGCPPRRQAARQRGRRRSAAGPRMKACGSRSIRRRAGPMGSRPSTWAASRLRR